MDKLSAMYIRKACASGEDSKMAFGKAAELQLLCDNLLICQAISHQLLQHSVVAFYSRLSQTEGQTCAK